MSIDVPQYRLISRRTDGEPTETIDLLADDLEAVVAFVRRQQALIGPPAELWHDGKLVLSLPLPADGQFGAGEGAASNSRDP